MIPNQEEHQHPVGGALEIFFSGIADHQALYTTIMDAHNNGFGFGVIAQALWLTQELKGNLKIFNSLLDARQKSDYSNFSFEENGPTVTSKTWGELKNAITAGKKIGNLGTVLSNSANANQDNGGSNNANGNNKDHGNDKDKGKDKNDNGNGNSNGSGNGNGK